MSDSGVGKDIIEGDHWEDQRIRIELFQELIEPIVVDFFKDRTMLDLVSEGQSRSIPVTPMLTPAEVLRAEQYEVLGSFTDGPVGGRTAQVASGMFCVDGERVGFRNPAPASGPVEHSPAWDQRTPYPADRGLPAGRPYAGLLVVEFGVAGAVPEMGRLLAEYGADVIRVESPKRLDLFRQLGGPSGVSGVFVSSNRSTRSLGVDYTHPEGAGLVKEVMARADVVLENLPPRTLERFGLGVDEIRAVNPAALIVSSQTMGRHGPWSHWRGYGSNTQLPGGMSWLWSFPDAPAPVPQNVAFPDHLVGRLGAVVVASQLVDDRGGRSQAGHHVEIVQAEMALNLLSDLFAKESLEPGSVRPQGNRSPLGAPWGVYPCQGEQRWCVITCRDDMEWSRLVAAIGSPDWTMDPRFSTSAGRMKFQDLLDDHIACWTSARRDQDVMTRLQAEGVPAGMMMYVSDQPNDPHFTTRGYILEIEQPGLGSILLEGPAFHATGLPEPITRPAPLLGQHTREICTTLLGYDNKAIDCLIDRGLLVENLP
jgi:crotonobetainyl-CoA:carnitine CoA-transferase CaiB-like acyl-CoA transferase